MVKYTAENKLQAVERYLSGNGSSCDIAKSLETDNKAILKWVKQFEHNGVDAFIKRCTTYTQEFKIDALSFMTGYGTSLNETAAIFNIPAPFYYLLFGKNNLKHMV